MTRLPISCCYIVKNEEQFLKASLESVSDWVSELIILDSGSNDKTEAIARSFQTRVPSFVWQFSEWKNDFSLARNTAATFAKQLWILFVDGDEVLDSKASSQIFSALTENISCYSFKQRNYSRESHLEEAKRVTQWPEGVPEQPGILYYAENWMERLYRQDRGLKYEGRIHESLLPSCERLNLKHARLEVVLHHFGRLKPSLAEKLEYYLRLTEQKFKEENSQPVAWIEFGINLMDLGYFEKAFELAEKAVQTFPKQPEVLRMAFQAALRYEQFQIGEAWIRKFLEGTPQDIYALSQLTTALLYQKNFDEVLKVTSEVFKIDSDNFVAHLNCGVIYFENQDWANASRHLEAALRAKPEDDFVREALKKVYAKLQKH